jgi:hypothetical protein
MTERRFVVVDFRLTSDVVGHIRLYDAGSMYDMLATNSGKRPALSDGVCFFRSPLANRAGF